MENPVIRAALEARIPEIKADFIASIRRTYAHQLSIHPGGIPAHPPSRHICYFVINETLRPVCDIEQHAIPGAYKADAKITGINEARLDALCQKAAEASAVEWQAKIESKLGDVANIRVSSAHGSRFTLVGSRLTPLGDITTVELHQDRIVKCSPKGRLFNQFPSRIYVNGRFTPEAAYHRMFRAYSLPPVDAPKAKA